MVISKFANCLFHASSSAVRTTQLILTAYRVPDIRMWADQKVLGLISSTQYRRSKQRY